MSLSNVQCKVQYAGNGILVNFNIPFLFLLNGHIVAEIHAVGFAPVPLVLGVDYTLANAGNPAGGTMTTTVAPATGVTLTIRRVVPLQQNTSYVQNDAFPSTAHEAALDYLTQCVQQLQEEVARCVQFPASEPGATNPLLPVSELRANLTLKFDGAGNILVS